MKKVLTAIAVSVLVASCSNGKKDMDAQGNFEATEIIISAESTGRIIELKHKEGDQVLKDKSLFKIDNSQLLLKKMQLEASVKVLEAKLPDAVAQLNVLKQQLETAKHEQARTERLVETNSATKKQLDDINSQTELLKKQIVATSSQLNTQTKSIFAEIQAMKVQILQVDDQIEKSAPKANISGTVLSVFAEEGEFVPVGKPVMKIADLSVITLKAYVTGDQLSEIKLGDTINVFTDKPKGEYNHYMGKITWISDKAEFAPKVIQTKDERVNLVYACKIEVANDGTIKIGMPGEVKFK